VIPDGRVDDAKKSVEMHTGPSMIGKTMSFRTAPIELPAFAGPKAILYTDWKREE
jgi:hypothetical protein